MKTVADSRTEQTHMLRYQHLNGQGRLFGGILMQWIDELAGIVASRHAGCDVTTASVDNLIFRRPGYLNDVLLLSGRITFIGKTSMEVSVDTYTVKRNGERHLINTAYCVMVATGDDGRAVPVPPIQLEGPEEHEEWERGKRRYELRKTRRKEDF